MKKAFATLVLALSAPVVLAGNPFEAKVGGPVAPDGTKIHVELPDELHCENITSRGQGCCVQTSINHSARWQNIPVLVNFHEWVRSKGIPGGAHPGSADQRMKMIAKEKGVPVPEHIQIERADHETLMLACKAGRLVCVTYSKSPTGRYRGQRIAHMVNCAHADEKWIAILDNNYIKSYEWMSPQEAKGTGVYEWIIVFLQPSAPPPVKD
jgi:hypothetical protein